MILQIYRERLKPGADASYHAIEEETARLAVALGCPHAYLGAESLDGLKEVWWFNAYASPDEPQQVAAQYAANTEWMAALVRNSERKASLTRDPVEVFAALRRDLTRGDPWTPGRGRFLTVEIASDPRLPGTVFEASDGTRYVIAPAQTRADADAARAAAGAESFTLAVRPTLSFPAPDWIAADVSFWAKGFGD